MLARQEPGIRKIRSECPVNGLSDGAGGAYLSFLVERNRVTVVPHLGQVPLAIGRPLDVSVSLPSVMVRLSRHLTQYP